MPLHKRKIITSIKVDTLAVASFDDFIRGNDSKCSSYALKKLVQKWDRWLNAFELNGLYVVFRGSNSLHKNLTVKQLLYIYYHYLFGVAMYMVSDTKRQSDGSIYESCCLINEYVKQKMEPSTGMIISKINCWHENEDKFKNFKKIIKWYAPKKSYDKKEEDYWESILRTGEIFNYLVATSKTPSPLPSYDKIRNTLLEDGGRSGFSNEELDRQIDVVRSFLFHTL